MSEEKDRHYRQMALDYRNRAKLKGCTAAVHVEADDDKTFWSKVFEYYLPQYSFDYITHFRTPEGEEKSAGCQTCLKYYRLGCLSKDFFICIDSDYRRLLCEPDMDVAHFIFQTYTHSIENHYCFHKNLEHVFEKCACDKLHPHDFFKAYSQTLYDLFIYHLISVMKEDGLFDKRAFRSYIDPGISSLDATQIISGLRNSIQDKLKEMEDAYTKSEIRKMRSRCSKSGLTGENAYLYFRGHDIYSQVVGKILNQLKRETGIKDICIGKNICFDRYPEINRIKADAGKYKQSL
jgi:hypothetical protein